MNLLDYDEFTLERADGMLKVLWTFEGCIKSTVWLMALVRTQNRLMIFNRVHRR